MSDACFQPVSGFDLLRFAGIPTFMRLPHVALEDTRLADVQIGLVGSPWDSGPTNRPGPRHGPRQMRDMSTMIRAEHDATDVRPFERALRRSWRRGAQSGRSARQHAADHRFLRAGEGGGDTAADRWGDHLCSLPILRALAADGPLGMIQFDSHTDLFHSYFGGTLYTHGTPFRRAVEEGLLDPKRMVQIGIRGTTYDREDREFAKSEGIRMIEIEEFHARPQRRDGRGPRDRRRPADICHLRHRLRRSRFRARNRHARGGRPEVV